MRVQPPYPSNQAISYATLPFVHHLIDELETEDLDQRERSLIIQKLERMKQERLLSTTDEVRLELQRRRLFGLADLPGKCTQ
jgi:hypothetical protein